MLVRNGSTLILCGLIWLWAALSPVAVSTSHANGYERGFAELEAGNYEEALYYISLHAANGDPRAQYTMGVMHRKGVAVKQDDREALLWFLASAEAGYMLGQYAAGLAFDRALGTDRNVTNAIHYLQEASLSGHAVAPLELGNLYFKGNGLPSDPAKAFFWWTIAERRNAPGAKQNLHKLSGRLTRFDQRRAEAYLANCKKQTLRRCFPRND